MSVTELERELWVAAPPDTLGRLGDEALDGLVDLAHRLVALLALVVLVPFLAGLALAVALDSRGPVLFRQVRVGRGGREFVLYKFRTMRTDAESVLAGLLHLNDTDGLLFKMRNDPRVSGVGRWLRRFSLDELPQLWNVVRGEMALVGPRPPLPHEVAAYDARIRRRLDVKPGLTGIWQVSGRSDLPWSESVRLDLEYVERRSVRLDLEILARTVGAVLSGRGAY